MTNSPTSSVPNTTSRVNHFTGLARKRRKFSLLPANGDGSTLSLDFTTGVLDPRLSFTRSTSGTYIGSDGYIKTMAAAPTNDPTKARFDYDPTTLAPRGLLIEASSTNYMLESTSLSGYSNSNMVAVSSGSEKDPEGNANSAKQIYASTITGYHSYFRTVTAGTNTTITVSIWAKARNYIYLYIADVSSGRAAVRFNLQTGATDNNFGAGYVSARATKYTNDWWRCEMVVSVVASTAYSWGFVGVPTSGATLSQYGAQYTGTGNAADGIYCYGFQVEGGSGASSYIPTGVSQGSRAYDHCYATGADFTSWFSVGAGTMVAVSDNIKNNVQNLAAMISDDSSNNYVRMGFKVNASANEYLLTTVGGPTSYRGAADSGYVPPLNTVYKMGYAWDTADFGIVANGGTVGTDLSGILAGAGVLNRLVVGGDFVAVPNDIYFKNGHIRSLKYWPTRLPNAQLQALTT